MSKYSSSVGGVQLILSLLYLSGLSSNNVLASTLLVIAVLSAGWMITLAF